MPIGPILTSDAMALAWGFSSCLKARVQKSHGFFHLNSYVERPLIVGKIVVARTAVAALASAAAAAVVVEAFVGRVLCTQIIVET
jgi:hypothetical protein